MISFLLEYCLGMYILSFSYFVRTIAWFFFCIEKFKFENREWFFFTFERVIPFGVSIDTETGPKPSDCPTSSVREKGKFKMSDNIFPVLELWGLLIQLQSFWFFKPNTIFDKSPWIQLCKMWQWTRCTVLSEMPKLSQFFEDWSCRWKTKNPRCTMLWRWRIGILLCWPWLWRKRLGNRPQFLKGIGRKWSAKINRPHCWLIPLVVILDFILSLERILKKWQRKIGTK